MMAGHCLMHLLTRGAARALLAIALIAAAVTAKKPPHPSKIAYPPLDWTVPLGAPYRVTLDNGLRAYIAEDPRVPIVHVTGYVTWGETCDPPGQEGLSFLMARLMRTGGTERYPADSLDKLLDHLAIECSYAVTDAQFSFTVSVLTDFLDSALIILQQTLFHPTFETARVEKERAIVLEKIAHRFDNPGPILDASYGKLMYPGQANSALTTPASIARITRDDLVRCHARLCNTENMIIAVSGRFDKNVVAQKLAALFPKAVPVGESPFPEIAPGPRIKCLMVHKPMSQAYVRFGVPTFRRPHDDFYALHVVNLVLGGGGFTSRLGTTVRSDAGLTYSIYSNAESNYRHPATFYVDFFTKNETTSQAIALSLREINRLVTDGVTDEELANAKKYLVDALPSTFRSPGDIVETYAWNEYFGRAPDHYTRYVESVKALTASDLLRVARAWLKPDSFSYVIVGDTGAIAKADTFPGFSLKSFTSVRTTTPDSVPALP
jgi:zinc protease